MWRRIGNIALVVAIWTTIIAYIVYSAMLVSQHKRVQNVERLNVEIADSTVSGQLITSQRVREMLLEQGIATVGVNIKGVDTRAIREMIYREGFVDYVGIYTSYSGTLHIHISQREPLFRLLVNGYNCYITADGYLFQSPEHAALHIPVVSGDYCPPFAPEYEGHLSQVLANYEHKTKDSVAQIGKELKPILEREQHWQSRRKDVRDSTITQKGERKRLYRYIDGHLRDCKREKEAVAARQQAVKRGFEQTVAQFEQLQSLIDFVALIDRDNFWRAEIVQIVATTTSDGRITLQLIPRSGNHRIEFGWLESCEQKMDKLRLFYDKVAVTRGWDSYKTVNVNFADTIVCTYKDEN